MAAPEKTNIFLMVQFRTWFRGTLLSTAEKRKHHAVGKNSLTLIIILIYIIILNLFINLHF